MADGETCDNNANQHGMRMFNFAGGEYYVTDMGRMTKNWEDGAVTSVTVAMTVSNDLGSFESECRVQQLDELGRVVCNSRFGKLQVRLRLG